MTRVALVTWNAEGMFTLASMTRRGTPESALGVLDELDADIVVIPEFGCVDPIDTKIETELIKRGYSIAGFASYYDDRTVSGYGIAVLSRVQIVRSETFPIGDGERRAVASIVVLPDGQEMCVVGVHLDDRSEAVRLRQAERVIRYIETCGVERVLVAGDFNAMDARSLFARLVRLLPTKILDVCVRGRMRSIVRRARDMAIGTTIDRFNTLSTVRNLDPGHARTVSARQRHLEKLPAWRLAKIDWIFGSPNLHVREYKVWRDIGSDHRPVRVTLES